MCGMEEAGDGDGIPLKARYRVYTYRDDERRVK